MLTDQNQRLQATDPTQSFIVQAPAGSGKTEILTQRFLRLLSTVQSPEQIIALTFTRKAANEMRERIILALQQAENKEPPRSEHQQQTLDFADAVLKRDRELNWQLLNQPGKLRIFTIDALCQKLIQVMPLQDNQLSYAQITDRPKKYYIKAARACLDYALQNESYHEALRCLLQHLDNQQERLLALFSDLLSKREQWLTPLLQARQQDKSQFEQALTWIEQHEIGRLANSLPEELTQLLTHVVRQLATLSAAPEIIQQQFNTWSSFAELDRIKAEGLASLLLTTQGLLRKGLDWRSGFSKKACPPALYQELKASSDVLFESLNECPDFIEALKRVQYLPNPEYDSHQWNTLQALFTLLPLLAAHLQMIFREHNEVDFSAVSQQALAALGDDEHPTDLALYLDYQIHHLLIDEFQDTSIQQFDLLSKLVNEWQPDEGKTLFVVGDPMQSIYRFRSAEVGLFLRAQQHGIGQIRLKSLELTCNFRSTGTIVDWVNQQFQSIFPNQDDIESGAVTFHHSDITQTSNQDSYVTTHELNDAIDEAAAIVDLVKKEMTLFPEDEIALLVRSRNDLQAIMRRLREEDIVFQGIDIDPLANLPHLMDVWSLTQALLMPANRLAWLSFLRSPWCGLSLADLHIIANSAKSKSIYTALSTLTETSGLSHEGLIRCRYLQQIFHMALDSRYQQSLVDWVINTLNNLHTNIILSDAEQADLEQFWCLLEQFEENGQLADWDQFREAFSKLYSQRVTPSKLQIMTIHKSKGLEFDSVILPGLSSRSVNNDKSLLRWLKLPTDTENLLLVSPVKAIGETECKVYNYLEKLDREKEQYETQRLLYVAATRAKKRLHLFDYQEKGAKGSFRDLLKHLPFAVTIVEKEAVSPHSSQPNLMYQLPAEYYLKPTVYAANPYSNLSLSDSISPARLIGIATHEILQWIADHHAYSVTDVPWSIATNKLRQHGFSKSDCEHVQTTIEEQITRLLDDPTGQWIMQLHEEERNEFELLINQEGEIGTKIIDRTFVDNGVRWIIDYKTGSESPESLAHHQEQITGYARILSHQFNEPIHCGLYYLPTSHWVSWAYSAA